VVSLYVSACGADGGVGVDEAERPALRAAETVDHRTVQPLEIRRAAEPPETEPTAVGRAPEHLDPLLEYNPGAAVEPAGLAAPFDPDRRDWVVAEPSDLATAASDQAQPALVFGPESRAYARCAADPDCLRLVTYPDGEVVPAERLEPEAAYGDISRRIVLVPAEPLESRWYALEVRLDEQVGESVRVGGVQIARFRPDSHPILSHALLGRRGGRSVLELRFSERLAGETPAEGWTITADDGSGLGCEILGPAPGREEHHAVFTCDRLAERSVTVDFGGPLRTVLRTELHDEDEVALTRVRVPVESLPEAGVSRVSLYAL
jgi:hypothetical protein